MRTDRLPRMHRASTVLVLRFDVQGSVMTGRCLGCGSLNTVLSSPFLEGTQCMYRARISSQRAYTVLREKIGQVCHGRHRILDAPTMIVLDRTLWDRGLIERGL